MTPVFILTLLFAADEGFGGTPAPELPPAQPDVFESTQAPPNADADAPAISGGAEREGGDEPCFALIEGRAVACAALLEEASGEAPAAPPDLTATDFIPGIDDVGDDDAEGDVDDGLSGPLGKAIREARARMAPTPLRTLREAVALQERRAQRAEAAFRDRKLDEHLYNLVVAHHRRQAAILEDVEMLALRERQSCADSRVLGEEMPRNRLPTGIRLHRGLTVVQIHLQTPDPYLCRRTTLITEADIARVARLHEVENRLATETFGYRRHGERRALEEEQKAITDELEGHARITALDGDGFTRPQKLKPVKASSLPRPKKLR